MLADYKEMYYKLFRLITQAILILQEAQKETEAMFIDSDATEIKILRQKAKDDLPDPEDKI